MVRAVDTGGIVDKVCITTPSLKAEFNPAELGHSEITALAKYLAAQLSTIDPQTIVGTITHLAIIFCRCLYIGPYTAIPDKVNLRLQQCAEYHRFMVWLEESGRLDRTLEFLPSDETLADRQNRGQTVWTRPELAVLVSYSKVMLKESLVEADLLGDKTLAATANSAFPVELVDRFSDEIDSHQLRNEIVATQLANDLVDRFGFTFYFRQVESTGASAGDIVRAFRASLGILGVEQLWQRVEENKNHLPADVQYDLFHLLMRLVRRTTRWLLRNRRQNLNCGEIIQAMAEPVAAVLEKLPQLHQEQWLTLWRQEVAELTERGVHRELAATLAQADSMFLMVGTVEMALRLNRPAELLARLNFMLGEILSLDWFMFQIVSLNPKNRWQDLARESYVDDLESQRRQLTAGLLDDGSNLDDIELLLENWQTRQAPLINRWNNMVAELRRGAAPDFAMVSVALRELLDLVEASKGTIYRNW